MKGSDIINCIVLKKGKGEITNGYSQGHTAIDLVGENYTIDDIVAHSSGTIIETQDGYSNMKGSTGILSYGNYLRIDHHNGYETLYAHMEKGLPVKAGATVEKGQLIGHMSDSGNAYGKHLHFEIIKNGTRINPTDYLDKEFPSNNNSSSSTKYQLGDTVKINGVYISSTSSDRLTPAITEGTITKIITGTHNPYLLDNGKIGWVNDNTIVSKVTKTNPKEYLSNTTYKGFSIVDALKEIGIDSSYNYRKQLAELNDISNYTGTGIQNNYMLNLLKQGKLRSK